MKLFRFSFSIVIMISLLWLTTCDVSAVAPIPHKTLKIIIDTTDLGHPKEVASYIENLNPQQYQTSFISHFYSIKQLSASGGILMTGEVKKQSILAPPDVQNGSFQQEGPHTISPNLLILNLPLYPNVALVQLFDENGTVVLGINVVSVIQNEGSRFAECNACGYCLHRKPPDNVNECMKCLYPGISLEDSLRIDSYSGRAPSVTKGKYFTQIGCLDVGLGSFSDPQAAGGVLNFFLTKLLFPITGVLALLALIYGAFLLMTAQDNPEQIQRGRSWIIGAIVGVVFVFGAILFTTTIGKDILKIPGIR